MKWQHLLFLILSGAAFVGSVIVMLVLVDLGQSISALEAGSSLLAVDPAITSGFAQQARALLFWGWIYTLLVFVVSLYGVRNAWKNLRSK